MTWIGVATIFIIFMQLNWSVGDEYCSDCYRQFKEGGIIPKYANRLKATNLSVEYGEHRVQCGEVLDLTQVLKAPKVTYDFKGKCKYATILGFYRDIVLGPMLVYLVHNVPGECFKNGFIGKGDVPQDNVSSEGDYGATYPIALSAYSTVRRIVKTCRSVENLSCDVREFQYFPYTLPWTAEMTTTIYFLYCQCYKIPKGKIKTVTKRTDRYFFDVKNYTQTTHLRNPVNAILHKRLLVQRVSAPVLR